MPFQIAMTALLLLAACRSAPPALDRPPAETSATLEDTSVTTIDTTPTPTVVETGDAFAADVAAAKIHGNQSRVLGRALVMPGDTDGDGLGELVLRGPLSGRTPDIDSAAWSSYECKDIDDPSLANSSISGQYVPALIPDVSGDVSIEAICAQYLHDYIARVSSSRRNLDATRGRPGRSRGDPGEPHACSCESWPAVLLFA